MAALPLRAKLLYSTSSLGGEALNQSRNAWLLFYYAPPADADHSALLKLGIVSLILAAGKFLDAFNDVLIGYWSDRTHSRLGRRIPFILTATPLWALCAFLVFMPPSNASAAAIAAYLFVTLQLYHLFATLSGGPYEALFPEIASTSRDRVSLVGIRVYFGVGGATIGLIGAPFLISQFGFQAMAFIMAALALAGRYTGMFGIWNHASRSQPSVDLSLRMSLRATFTNTHFLRFLPTFVLFQAGLAMLLGALPYFVVAVLHKESAERWVAILTGVAILAMVSAVPIFTRVARRTSKRQAFKTALLGSTLMFPLFAFAGFVPGIPRELQAIAIMMLIGMPIAGMYLFPAALIADICDYDAIRTGMRREATFYGAQNFVEKAAGSISPLLLGWTLMLGNTIENPIGVRLVGPVAGAVVLTGYLIFRSYDLADEVLPAEETMEEVPAAIPWQS